MARSPAIGVLLCVWMATLMACGSTPAADGSHDAAATGSSVPPTSAAAAPAANVGSAPAAARAQARPEDRLRAEVAAWKKTPYRDHGTTKEGIGQAEFVRALYQATYALDLPATLERQLRTGKLVERDALAPGDLVFFEGQGVGPFRSKWVAVYLGGGEAALAHKELGVAIVKLADARWKTTYKTARRIPTDPTAKPPAFDATRYGSNRAALLRDIANAWSGTLYKQGGTTFDGIGNDEFVREVYEAVHEDELDGSPSEWASMGEGVTRDDLEPGDIILYEAVGITSLFNRRHAGIYLGDGDFVHAVKGAAVTISDLDDARWSAAFKSARRLDPETLARVRDRRAAARAKPAAGDASAPATAARIAPPPPPPPPTHLVGATELKLRADIEPWRGTPYKIGGTTKSGIDCSAFTRAIYDASYQMALPRTADEQERLGTKVDRSQLQTGDLVFFRTQGMGPLFRSRHVGIYLGGGEFAHASGKNGVTISRLDNRYWSKKYATARRVSAAR
jgi:cell wall-associated NlpC family hydrolase